MDYIAESEILLKKQIKKIKNNEDTDSDHQYFQELQDKFDEDLREEKLVNEMAREMDEDNDLMKLLLRHRLRAIKQHIREQQKLKPAGYIPIPATIYTKCK